RRQRADPGAGGVLLVRRLEGVAVRRQPHVRTRGHPLLHAYEGRDHPLARPSDQLGRPRLPEEPVSGMSDREQVVADDRAHVFHSWSAQGKISPLPIASAEGAWFADYDGNRYLDLGSQLVNANLGHQHPDLVAAITEQAQRLCTVAPAFANDKRGELARLIAERTPGDLDSVFFTNGGADAIEHAVRTARLHTGRHKVLSAYRSYHGGTAGAMTLTGEPRRWGSEPGMPGVVRFFGPYPYRSAFHAADAAEECERALAHLEQVFELEGPHN